MHLTPKEIDKLMLLSLGMVAERRMKKGLKLNYPEAVAYLYVFLFFMKSEVGRISRNR